MNRKNARRLGWLMVGMAVCLTAPACRTCVDADTLASETPIRQATTLDVVRKLETIIIPEAAFRPPVTIIDAVEFFIQASRDYDDPNIPLERRGVDFMLRLPHVSTGVMCDILDPFADAARADHVAPEIPPMVTRLITLYDALKLVCDVTGMKMRIIGNVVCIEPNYDDMDGQLLTSTFALPPPLCGVCGRIHTHYETPDTHVAQPVDWKAFLESMGVAWPEGSSITPLTPVRKLRVTNRPKDLALIEQIFDDLVGVSRQINIETQIIAFRRADIEKLQLAGNVTLESLMALRKKGKAKLVATASTITKSEQEAMVKAVQEMIFPTEWGTDNTNATAIAATLMPRGFEMREVGMILQVVPELLPASGSKINVILNSDWVTLDRWETYPARVATDRAHKPLSLRQPVFTTTTFQTQATLENGETILLGSSSAPDGAWIHYGFLKATLIPAPKTINAVP